MATRKIGKSSRELENGDAGKSSDMRKRFISLFGPPLDNRVSSVVPPAAGGQHEGASLDLLRSPLDSSVPR